MVSIYHLSSESAASERITREQLREQELDNLTRQRAIEAIASERLAEAELLRYMTMVEEGRISAADARAAIRAGRTLGQEEMRQGRDIDGGGNVGNQARHLAPRPVYASETVSIPRGNNQHPEELDPSKSR